MWGREEERGRKKEGSEGWTQRRKNVGQEGETRWGREEEGERQRVGEQRMEQKEESKRLEGPRETTTRSDGSDSNGSNGSEKKQGRRIGERLQETHNNQTHM
jgi:hypothetical protein